MPERFPTLLATVTDASATASWSTIVAALAELDTTIRTAQTEVSVRLRTRARAFAEWAGETPERLAELDAALRGCVEPVAEGRLTEGAEAVNALLLKDVPEGAQRREAARAMGKEIRLAGNDLGVPTQALEAALQTDAEAGPLDWPTTVVSIEGEAGQLTEALREKVGQAAQSLAQTLASLKDYEVDATQSLVVVEDLAGKIPTAGPGDLPRLLAAARAATEQPVVGIVASLLDSVRPKLVEARRLGRDASDVFSAMNRAREALRLKIYSEALAASQEAVDRVAALTQDLDAARAEVDSVKDLLSRLATSGFATAPYDGALERVEAHLARVELPAARDLLADTIRRLGSETVGYFTERFVALDRIAQVAGERGFLPPDLAGRLSRARELLDSGDLAAAAEAAAAVDSALRTAAEPYVARRVEELETGFKEIPDESLVAPVRRLLADADVNLRVKGDLPGSLESLRRAEREFSAVFAAHASTLVEMLEEERKVLEAMGGTGDEIQRQIDEVQQIFNMGDFVKASRTSLEIRTRAQQQQLVRSEEAVSHAKLALVELGKMGLEPGSLRARLESAQTAARERHYAQAYQVATEVLEGAGRTKGTAQRILDGMSDAGDLFQQLKEEGIAVDAYRDQLRLARAAYQALDFEAALSQLTKLLKALTAVRAEAEAHRLEAEIGLLIEDAHRIGLDVDRVRAASEEVARLLSSGDAGPAETRARAVHTELIQLLRPVLADRLRTIEQDLEVARSTGVDAPEVVELLGDARRRLAQPVPSGVAETLDQARSKLVETRGFLEHAERVARRARDALGDAELARVNVAEGRARLDVVEAALAQKEYAKVIDLASTLEREMILATGQQVGRTLAGVQASAARARHEGSDTAIADNLLRQARNALEEGRPLEALQRTSAAAGELERIELQLRIAEGALEAMERHLATERQQGVRSPAAETAVSAGRAAFASRSYAEVLDRAMEASDALEAARDGHRRARDALDAADRQVKETLEMGADAGHALPLLEQARGAHQAGEYGESIRLAREAAEGARWALERQYTGNLTEVRRLLDVAVARGVHEGIDGVTKSVDAAEGFAAGREWETATESLSTARARLREAVEAHVTHRLKALDAAAAGEGGVSPAEAEARAQVAGRVTEAVRAGDFPSALDTLEAEATRRRDRRKLELTGRLAELKDRLWVGEKLGLDTTPVMELFTEAEIAVQAGRFDGVDSTLQSADDRLKGLVRSRIADKLEEVMTELNFAREGLHVSVDPIAQSLQNVGRLEREGQVLLAGRTLLEASEELNRRKALHRELMNLHYLIDAALARATERHLDTARARTLLEESIQIRGTDYAGALAKAREALQLLQGQLKTPESPTGFWAIRRPPTQT